MLVGHSFGTAIALELALTAPESFPAMLLLSPTPLDGLHTPRYLEPILKGYRTDRRGLRQALKRTMRTRTPPYLDDLVDEARMMHPASFSGNARLLSDWRMDGQLRGYTNPVLVASGERDTLVPPSSGEATARAFPYGAYACIPSVGHSPQIEAPEKVRYLLGTLLNFMDGGPSSAGRPEMDLLVRLTLEYSEHRSLWIAHDSDPARTRLHRPGQHFAAKFLYPRHGIVA